MQNLIIYHRNIDPSLNLCSFLDKNIKKDEFYIPELKAYTSYPRYEICSPIKPFYDRVIGRAMMYLGISFANFDSSIWAQIYTPTNNSRHQAHNHWSDVAVDFSWVHFIKTPDKRCFRFTNGHIPPQNDGDFIIFPSWAVHTILPFSGECDRMVVAGNVMLKNAKR